MSRFDNENYNIAAYLRISVDDDLDNDNTSIENQRAIIESFIKERFPGSFAEYFEDRDISGYTFEERPGYQKMKEALLGGFFNILIVKDFSRFGRRNSYGLMELETLRDAGVRVISIGDSIDYPKNNDWLMIQFRFLMNEIPVTETSKKIKAVIKHRQKEGKWICNCPFGYYLHPTEKNKVLIDEEGAAAVRLIFDLYNSGWGYKKIAGYLTKNNVITPSMLMKKRVEKNKGQDEKNGVWSHVSVAKIVKNDFYIGTLRQNIWERTGINKKDKRLPVYENYVFPDNHAPIIEKETFERAQEESKRRGCVYYKGVRKYPSAYGGYLFCADCSSPMFSIAGSNRPMGYICGRYHRHGLSGCTSHRIREEMLDKYVKDYIRLCRDRLLNTLTLLDAEKTKASADKDRETANCLKERITETKSLLKEAAKRRIKESLLNPKEKEIISETFGDIEKEYLSEIKSLENQIAFISAESGKKRELKNNINRVLLGFNSIISKEKLSKADIGFIINRITVDSDRVVYIELKASISELFELNEDKEEKGACL